MRRCDAESREERVLRSEDSAKGLSKNLAGLPYTALLTRPALVEGLLPFFSSVPSVPKRADANNCITNLNPLTTIYLCKTLILTK